MRLAERYIPYGALPYDNLKLATHMVARLYGKCPYIALLPNIYGDDTLEKRTLLNMPGIRFRDGKILIRTGTERYENEIAALEDAFNSPAMQKLERFGSDIGFLEKYLQIIKKFNSPNAYINLLGPFTVSQILLNVDKEQMLADKSYRKLFVLAVCIKALWIIEKIKEVCPATVPVVILEEPQLGQLGIVRRSNEEITTEVVVGMMAKVTEKLQAAGAIVGVQCFDKCDWSVPIQAGVDLISFDAYNNPNNLHVIKDAVNKFLQRGGMINWACVPIITGKNIKNLSVDYLSKRLFTTIKNLSQEGVPLNLLYNLAVVSMNVETSEIPAMFAEKSNMTLVSVADRLRARVR